MRLPLLILHILGGTIGLLSGTFAIVVRKGSRLHRASGNVFTIAMLTLASSGLCLAILKSQTGNIIGSIVTFYMITTAWLAGRRRNIGPPDWAALLVGIGGAVAQARFDGFSAACAVARRRFDTRSGAGERRFDHANASL